MNKRSSRQPGPSRRLDAAAAAPRRIKAGNVTIKIYTTVNRHRPLHTVSYYLGNSRRRESFRDLDRAESHAKKIAVDLQNGQLDVLELRSADKQNYVHAMRELAPLGLPLHTAVEDYARAKARLGEVPLAHAIDLYVARHAGVKRQTTSNVVKEFLAACKADNVDQRTIDEARRNLRWFTEAFAAHINDVSLNQLTAWLRGMKQIRGNRKGAPLAARTRNNRRESLVTLFLFAQKQRYLSPNVKTEAELTPIAKQDGNREVGIFTPTEMATLLKGAPVELHPFLTLGGFAGIRNIEIQRMSWDMISWDANQITLPANVTKTRRRRIVPIQPALRAFLIPFRHHRGAVCAAKAQMRCRKIAANQGIEWKHNVLRHSAASYRVAATQHEPQTARELGTSVGLIHTNYDAVVTPEQAEQWWSIRPSHTIQA